MIRVTYYEPTIARKARKFTSVKIVHTFDSQIKVISLTSFLAKLNCSLFKCLTRVESVGDLSITEIDLQTFCSI